MDQINLSFEFTRKFEDFISLGGGHWNAVICASSPAMLFDPGVSVFGPRCLKELRACTSSTENLIIALSHSHFDHCGAAAYLLRKIPSARLAASQHAADILQRPNAVELIRKLDAEYEKSMEVDLAGEDVQRYLFEATAAAVAYKDMIKKYLELYRADQKKVVDRITKEEYDTQPLHIQNRQPFILNLRAKVNAVSAWLASQNGDCQDSFCNGQNIK
jgi:metal-dependent hydrolase (beta-lactamase superfamily II)